MESPDQLITVKVCGDRTLTPRQRANIVIAEVSPSVVSAPRILDRRFVITSACGVCGSTSIADLHKRNVNAVVSTPKTLDDLAQLPELLTGNQNIFERTGGLHAALLVNREGVVKWAREDVGRHNAVDKVIGGSTHGWRTSALRMDDCRVRQSWLRDCSKSSCSRDFRFSWSLCANITGN
ncbi:MAG: formate dehydrogenase accessory sulfurtransferase FdhD [Actinomycetota bacterium]